MGEYATKAHFAEDAEGLHEALRNSLSSDPEGHASPSDARSVLQDLAAIRQMRGVIEAGCEEAVFLELSWALWSAESSVYRHTMHAGDDSSLLLHLSTRVSLSSFLLHQFLDQLLYNQPCLFQSAHLTAYQEQQ